MGDSPDRIGAPVFSTGASLGFSLFGTSSGGGSSLGGPALILRTASRKAPASSPAIQMIAVMMAATASAIALSEARSTSSFCSSGVRAAVKSSASRLTRSVVWVRAKAASTAAPAAPATPSPAPAPKIAPATVPSGPMIEPIAPKMIAPAPTRMIVTQPISAPTMLTRCFTIAQGKSTSVSRFVHRSWTMVPNESPRGANSRCADDFQSSQSAPSSCPTAGHGQIIVLSMSTTISLTLSLPHLSVVAPQTRDIVVVNPSDDRVPTDPSG